ncbi:MAG: hypothetical protein AB8G22_04720 [Saprospiraceae bacterium]
MTQRQQDHLDTLSEIRSMMERSSRFLSLSGLSGIAAGFCALIGAAVVYAYLETTPFAGERAYYLKALKANKWGMNYQTFFLLDAALVLLAALTSGIFFTSRKAKKKGQKIWDALTLRLLTNLAIPLITGGIFCLALIYHGSIGLVAPATLVFYGLALINGSKYTLNDIRYLGILEVLLGLIALFNLGYGLEFWVIGFGILHIIYGTYMYFKYEKDE